MNRFVSHLKPLLDQLETFYGVLPKPPRDPFTLFVWEVLSVHATPRRRDAALAALKRIRALTPDAMWRAPQKKLEDAVALAGPYADHRLRALKRGVDIFRRTPDLPAMIKGPATAACSPTTSRIFPVPCATSRPICSSPPRRASTKTSARNTPRSGNT